MEEPTRILQIVPNMQAGGLEAFIMNLYRDIDKSKIQFDFLVHYNERKFFDDEIEMLGGKIYRFSLRDDNRLIKYIHDLNQFYKNHSEYNIIHCHMSSIGFINFLIAKRNGIKVRIAHSHNTNTEKTIKGFIKSLLIKPLKYISTHNFACSSEAGEYLYRKKKYEVIPNSIDLEKFKFNENVRKIYREKLNINEKLVIGHIGRFEKQKNHKYILDVFKAVHDIKENAFLLLAGSGSLLEKMVDYSKQLGIYDNILFLGVIDNAHEFYQALDVFILPSLFEGLPVVGVEAQVSGVRCLFADNISKEILISDYSQFLPIDRENIDDWKEQILISKSYDRTKVFEQIKNTKYNSKTTAKWLERFYLQVLKK